MNIREIHICAWTIIEEVYVAAKCENAEEAQAIWNDIHSGRMSPLEGAIKLSVLAKYAICEAENEYYADKSNL